MTSRLLQEDGSLILLETGEQILIEEISLVVAGVDFTDSYVTGSPRIREVIQNKSGVMYIDLAIKQGQSVPLQGAEIVFRDILRKRFAGFITRITPAESGKGAFFTYRVEASDYSFIFGNKIVKRAYQNKTLGYIVNDIMTRDVGAVYGFNLTNVATGPTITSIAFDHVSVRKAFEKLSKLTGYVWNVDYDKNLYFNAPTALPAPEAIRDVTTNLTEVNIAYDTSQVRNKVIVIGSENGEESLSPTSEVFIGNEQTRSWELSDKPSNIISIKLNGVPQQYSLDLNERESDIFVYSFSDKRISVTFSQPTPSSSDTILVEYYPRLPIIAVAQDDESIAFFKALDGGNGIWDYTLKEPSIGSKQEAADRARKELDQFADPLVKGVFKTRTSLLSNGTIFEVGQALTVNLPTYGINTDTTFLIQEINTEMVETQDRIEYQYTIRFGGRLAGVQEFLESLASESEESTNEADIKTIELLTDEATVGDSGLSMIKQTPPFKYGPSAGPTGRFNVSEWS